jgi:hypothetical protein
MARSDVQDAVHNVSQKAGVIARKPGQRAFAALQLYRSGASRRTDADAARY